MEKQKENIQPLNEEELEQASGGTGTPDPKEEKIRKPPTVPQRQIPALFDEKLTRKQFFRR
ncbi:MAG: hypothetical protein ACI4J1_07635 [Ruminiclostridium sp.]